jgi:hypothetical protein
MQLVTLVRTQAIRALALIPFGLLDPVTPRDVRDPKILGDLPLALARDPSQLDRPATKLIWVRRPVRGTTQLLTAVFRRSPQVSSKPGALHSPRPPPAAPCAGVREYRRHAQLTFADPSIVSSPFRATSRRTAPLRQRPSVCRSAADRAASWNRGGDGRLPDAPPNAAASTRSSGNDGFADKGARVPAFDVRGGSR